MPAEKTSLFRAENALSEIGGYNGGKEVSVGASDDEEYEKNRAKPRRRDVCYGKRQKRRGWFLMYESSCVNTRAHPLRYSSLSCFAYVRLRQTLVSLWFSSHVRMKYREPTK